MLILGRFQILVQREKHILIAMHEGSKWTVLQAVTDILETKTTNKNFKD